jgi:putative membrane protein
VIAALVLTTILAQAAPAPTPAPIAPMRENQAPVAPSNPPLGIPPVTGVDKLFALAAMQGGNAEIDMARLALQRSHTTEVRAFAEKMLSEHMGIDDAMRPSLMHAYGEGLPPQRLATADQLALDHLRTISDVDFDQVYLMQQIGDHLATLTAFHTEADNGTDPQLVALTKKWLPTIQAHLELAVETTDRIGGATPFKSGH